MNSYQRCWTAYEKNQLLKHNYTLNNLEQYGDMPVEYITGFAEFLNRNFKVSQSTLIPRVESEELVLMAAEYLKQIADDKKKIQMLDVGTGCGNIALSVFLNLNSPTYLQVCASDVDEACNQQAKENLSRLVEQKYHQQFYFFQSDLLKNIPSNQLKYQLITANLPYVPSSLLVKVDNSVKYFEPNLALDGGEDGLHLVRQLIAQVPSFLDEDGLLMMEIDSRAVVTAKSLALPENWSYVLLKDQWDKQRFVVVSRHKEDELQQIVSTLRSEYNEEQSASP